MFHTSHSSNSKHVLVLIALILTLCAIVATPAFAADPEEVDPDPEQPFTQVLTVSDLAELDTMNLAPGRYLVRVVDADGDTKAVHEIVVERSR